MLCKDCTYWKTNLYYKEDLTDGDTWGECELIEEALDSRYDPKPKRDDGIGAVPYVDFEPVYCDDIRYERRGLVTRQDFGCVYFEQK